MDDGSAASGQMTQDMQANHGGYNYSNWYQVCDLHKYLVAWCFCMQFMFRAQFARIYYCLLIFFLLNIGNIALKMQCCIMFITIFFVVFF